MLTRVLVVVCGKQSGAAPALNFYNRFLRIAAGSQKSRWHGCVIPAMAHAVSSVTTKERATCVHI